MQYGHRLLWAAIALLSLALGNLSAADVDSIGILISELGNHVAGHRIRAANELAKRGPEAERAIGPLIERLQDPHPDVRLHACSALGRIGGQPLHTLPPLIDLLDSSDEHLRYAAEWSIARISNRSAARHGSTHVEWKSLQRLLERAEASLRRHGARDVHLEDVHLAAERVREFAAEESRARVANSKTKPIPISSRPPEPTLERLRETERRELLARLENDHPVETVLLIESLANHSARDVDLHRMLLDRLAEQGNHIALAFAGRRWSSMPNGFRETASPHESTPVLHALLDIVTSGAAHPAWATEVVQNVGANVDTVESILRIAVSDVTPVEIRLAAIELLGTNVKLSPIVLPALTEIVQRSTDQAGLRRVAIESLAQLDANAQVVAPELLRRLLDEAEHASVQAAAAEALPAIDPYSATAVRVLSLRLQQSVVDEKEELAISVLRAIGQYGELSMELLPQIEAILDTDHESPASNDVRRAAVGVVGAIAPQSPHALETLLRILLSDEESAEVQVAAARALKSLGPPAVTRLVSEFRTASEETQFTLLRVFVELGPAAESALTVISEVAFDPSWDFMLRERALAAIGSIGPAVAEQAEQLSELAINHEERPRLRALATVAYARVGKEAQPVLRELAGDASAEVRLAAAFGLHSAGDTASSLELLLPLLDDDLLYEDTMRVLEDIGEAAVPRLMQTLHDQGASADRRLSCLQILIESDLEECRPLLLVLNDRAIAEEVQWELPSLGTRLLFPLARAATDATHFTPDARELVASIIEDISTGLGGAGEGGPPFWTAGNSILQEKSLLGSLLMESGSLPSMATEEAHGLGHIFGGPIGDAGPRASTGLRGSGSGGGGSGGLGSIGMGRLGAGPTAAPKMANRAVERISEEPINESAGEPSSTSAEAPLPAGVAPLGEDPSMLTTVKVFYGTNRRQVVGVVGIIPWWLWFVGIGVMAITALATAFIGVRKTEARPSMSFSHIGVSFVLLLAICAISLHWSARPSSKQTRIRYGGEYQEGVELGICEVTIPHTHQVGELETPSILQLRFTPDAEKDIVLQHAERLESQEFYRQLHDELDREGKHLLVFIHGYNVAFDDAARRTAQMVHDLEFPGAGVFYSWPSQANWYRYRMDKENIELSVNQIKTFLMELAAESEADTINLIAHSMGTVGLTQALKEMETSSEKSGPPFHQLVLAAPDIDSDIFKQRIAPAITSKAKRVTLYASQKDLALIASRYFNTGPRAGDAGSNILLIPKIETIDVTAVDTSLLGHSYYGSSVSVLDDLAALLRNEPAESRPYMLATEHDEGTFWIFEPPQVETARPTQPVPY